MSNRRAIIWLTFLMLVAVAGNVMVSFRRSERRHLRNSLIEFDSVSDLSIIHHGASIVHLKKDAEWRMVEPYPARVDQQSVVRLLDSLATATVDDSITDSELLKLNRKRSDFRLDTPSLTISMIADNRPLTIDFGSQTASSNGVYAAIGGTDTILVVPVGILGCVGLSADKYRSRELTAAGQDAIEAFDVKNSAGSMISFKRSGDGWQTDGKSVSAPKIREFLDTVASTGIDSFIWPTGATNETAQASVSLLSTYGLDSESASSLTFRYSDGSSSRIVFGREADTNRVYALVQNGGAIVTVDSAIRDMVMRDNMRFSDSRLFPIAIDDVTSFSIVNGSTSYVLARGTEGRWRLEAPIVAPADTRIADTLLGRILAFTQDDPVDDQSLSVSVNTNSSAHAVSASALLGKERLEDLRSREIADIDPTLIKRLVSSGQTGQEPTSIVHERTRNLWNIESSAGEGNVNTKAVERIMAVLHPLKAERIVCLKASTADIAGFGLEKPFHTLSIDQEKEGALRRNLMIGGKTNGGRFATIGNADAVFVLSEAAVKTLTAGLIEN